MHGGEDHIIDTHGEVELQCRPLLNEYTAIQHFLYASGKQSFVVSFVWICDNTNITLIVDYGKGKVYLVLAQDPSVPTLCVR